MTVKSQLSDDQMDQTSKYSYLDVKVFLKEKMCLSVSSFSQLKGMCLSADANIYRICMPELWHIMNIKSKQLGLI